eukprot:CAMPEP_0168372486 /NCGR_PEP_ID=MMETSP0228-20121227/8306_1 /TAXON_ID=133427 /ORGANISM="Protoceratium reticulatum, Strain CCCM 535 (=CCMP 1889)" /LENGTH=589 /DNA_ID=CAMNT_0008385395 /DNA_START=27 /DNA_END=1796 /DNA_ORIENTATION=+
MSWDSVSRGSAALALFWSDAEEYGRDENTVMWRARYRTPAKLPGKDEPGATGICGACQPGGRYLVKVMWRPLQAPGIKVQGVRSNWQFARQETHVEKRSLSIRIWRDAAEDAKKHLAIAHSECAIAHEVHGADGEGKISDCLLDHVGSVEDGLDVDGLLSGEVTLFTVHFFPGMRLGEFWPQGILADGAAAPFLFVTIAAQALESLMKVNTAKYVHHNIGVDAFGVVRERERGGIRVRLTDFDMALKAEEDARSEGSPSNLNAPPEWTEKAAFSENHPYTFDNYQLANLLMELLTGMSMLELVYVSWKAIFQQFQYEALSGKDAWCDAQGYRHHASLCDFHHMRAVFGFITRKFKTNYRSISMYVNLASKKKEVKLPVARKVWDNMVRDFQEFPAFMDVVGSMLQSSPEKRPANAQTVLETPAFLDLLKAVVGKATEMAKQRGLADEHVVMSGPGQQSVGARFERTSGSKCYFADAPDGPHRNEVDTGVDVSATICRSLCEKDGGCANYAVSAEGGCLVYTRTEPEDFKLEAAKFAPQEFRAEGPDINGREIKNKTERLAAQRVNLKRDSGREATENEDAGWKCYSKAD